LCAYVISLPLHVNSALLLQVNAVFLSLALGVGLRVYQMPDIVRHSTSETAHLHWARSSGTFFAITTLGLLEGQLPLYALGQMARLDQAGMFQAANLVVGVVAMGLAAVNLPLQPRLAEAWARGDKAAVQRLVTETARLASIAALPVVLLMLIMPETILGLYGEQYMQAATALRILAIGQMFNALAGSCGMLLLMTGHQRVVMQGAALALLINIGAAYVFIPRYEVSGAAFAVALSIIVWNVFYVAYAMRKLGVRTFLKAA
jgi:O-antigen/teichoic acid export membrane protein